VCYFAFFVNRLYAKNGRAFTIRYLKACQVLVMQAVASHRIADVGQLGLRVKRSKAGFPIMIPVKHRTLLKSGDVITIRAWITLLGVYRVLTMPGILKTSTITDLGVSWEKHFELFLEASYDFWMQLWTVLGAKARESFHLILAQPIRLFPIVTSNPLTNRLYERSGESVNWIKLPSAISTSWASILISAEALMCNPEHAQTFLWMKDYVYSMGQMPFLDTMAKAVDVFRTRYRDRFRFKTEWGEGAPPLGRLSLKEEPAGKVRVFAMVDPWTQWLFFPLHKALQSVLRLLSEDGTFNQLRPAQSLMERVMKLGNKPKLYSFDLSAATDRLPGRLQSLLLTTYLGEEIGNGWLGSLTDRAYVLYSKVYNRKESLKYAVGQPMGALSSWVMLAITHHFLVQFSHWRNCKKSNKAYEWFREYAVLGDDIVIGDPQVACSYLETMAILGVGIGLAKSVICRGNLAVMEFAKRYMVAGLDASMVSPRDVIVARLSSTCMSEFMTRHRFSLNAYLAMRGLGYRARGSVSGRLWSLSARLRLYLVLVTSPGAILQKHSFIDWIFMDSIHTSLPVDEVTLQRIHRYLYDLLATEYMPRLLRCAALLVESKSAKPLQDLINWDVVKPFPVNQEPVILASGRKVYSGQFPYAAEPETTYHSWGNSDWGYVYSEDMGLGWIADIGTSKAVAGYISENPVLGTKVPMERAHGMAEWLLKNQPLNYWKFAVSNVWEMLRAIDKDALTSRVSFEVQERVEESSYTTFLPTFNRWVAIQGIIRKSLALNKRECAHGIVPWTSESANSRWVRLAFGQPLFTSKLTYLGNHNFFGMSWGLPQPRVIYWSRVMLMLRSVKNFLVLVDAWIGKLAVYCLIAYVGYIVGSHQATVEESNTSIVVLQEEENNLYRVGIIIIMVCVVLAVVFGWNGGGSDPVQLAPLSDPSLIPLRLPAEVGNQVLESRLTRISEISSERLEYPSSPIMLHGYWE
jgi:hypothetical protein